MSAAEDRDCFWPSPALSLELVEHMRNDIRVSRESSNDLRDAEKLHAEGSEKYRLRWLKANERAVALLMGRGLKPEHFKLLGARMAKALCEWSENG